MHNGDAPSSVGALWEEVHTVMKELAHEQLSA